MKATIGKSSEKFAANLEQLKKESATQIKRSFDSITTLKDFITESGVKKSPKHYTKLSAKIDSVEERFSGFEDSLNHRVAKLIREYDRLKSKLKTLAKERDIYKTLYEFSIDISSERDLTSLLERVVRTTTEVLACDYAALRIVGDDGSVLFKYDSSLKNGDNGKRELSKQIASAVLTTGDPVRIDAVDGPESGHEICVPIKSDGNILGLLYSVRYDKEFSQFDLELLQTITDKIAISVESEQLQSALNESRECLMDDLREKYYLEEIVGNSPQITKVLAAVADVADTDSAVLIEGESGTGKELLARALHLNSYRRDQPFVTINCAAIPETLLESELFGYEKGAFAGAVARKPGKFELADKGTIFLDEIGELSQLLQVKLLRFLQSHEFELLGSTTVTYADVRILSATNKDLMKSVESGEFRDDLFYRINVIDIKLPALSERQGDVEILVRHFIEKYAKKNERHITAINDTALGYLKEYKFPGNIRELENIIERAIVLCKNSVITPTELPSVVKKIGARIEKTLTNLTELNEFKKELWKKTVTPIERNFALNLLEASGGNISSAARMGGMRRKQLQRILKRANIADTKKNRMKAILKKISQLNIMRLACRTYSHRENIFSCNFLIKNATEMSQYCNLLIYNGMSGCPPNPLYFNRLHANICNGTILGTFFAFMGLRETL